MKNSWSSVCAGLLLLIGMFCSFISCQKHSGTSAKIVDTSGRIYQVNQLTADYVEPPIPGFTVSSYYEPRSTSKTEIVVQMSVTYDDRIHDEEKISIPFEKIKHISFNNFTPSVYLIAQVTTLSAPASRIDFWDGSYVVYTDKCWIEFERGDKLVRALKNVQLSLQVETSEIISNKPFKFSLLLDGFHGLVSTPYGKEVPFKIALPEVREIAFLK